jgi:hypothetical protein
MPRPLLLPLCVCLALLLGGACASTERTGRDVLRVAPLRERPARPAAVHEELPYVDAGADILDDDELERVRADLRRSLEAAVTELGAEQPAQRALGTARVQRCTLKGAPTPRRTLYVARCRVALEVRGVAVLEVEAEAQRSARARAVSEAEAERIRGLVRNPLLSYEDSRAALDSAVRAAVEQLIAGELADDADDEELLAVITPAAMRANARDRLGGGGARDRAAAAVDLARWGTSEDAALVAPLLDDEDALVRRAAATALGELLDVRTRAALAAHVEDPDPLVADAVKTALARLDALYPSEPDPIEPSKSSTEGGDV